MTLTAVLIAVFVCAGLLTVLTRSLIRAAIGLALTSVVLSILMYALGSPWAAVFELSVCAGLIPVIFIGAISLTEMRTVNQVIDRMHERRARFLYLPVIVIAAGAAIYFISAPVSIPQLAPPAELDVRNVLWHLRQRDLIAQMLVLLAGVFGVAVLFKEYKK